MKATIEKLLETGKGLLAADESVHTATKRLADVGVESTEETRRQYRNLFLSAPNIEEYTSGVILFEETFSQKDNSGTDFPALLAQKEILSGIRVDESTAEMAGFEGEVITRGLDTLAKDLLVFKKQGAVFTKWRAVFEISDDTPTREAVEINSVLLAQYARMVQNVGMLPILEPEVLLTGDHDLQQAQEVTTKVLQMMFDTLAEYRVDLANIILKSSMVIPGSTSIIDATAKEIAYATVQTLMATVPANVPGVVFLSGGQTSEEAIENLNEIAKLGPFPWKITFSYARALQGGPLKVWQGKDENIEQAQHLFIETLKKASLAQQGLL
ncbi:fructose-bisphosphate aldolase class I [candidate division WWE3 bacterium CG_4_9_14_3_um_filter_41_6]|uniref:fructose-bisphosphate aldolase n=1 Tax=candidate division WWE3 bacterium CG_4_10_14_0_2_um_filter_41_14 TaxID=1975072 RepID=A0A2M7TL68_UNCKA|nr:MAG: fructose-bisphosphate aldolase class I [candidate division WWE3 bacterium CG_4_10_14_0_2_um_filter_41_14]PJA38611.1 MAG: fructose-bisphosphate aldolase class I [candidate division WWE3 bacterium CG_4_9_14_3_um_filter_41_6]